MSKQTTTKHSSHSAIPSDWEMMEFGEFAETEKGKYVPVENEDLRCLELEHFDQGTGQVLGWVNSSEQKSTKNKFKKGQVLFGKLRPYLEKYWLAEYDGVCSSEVWVLKSKNNKCSNEFLFRLVQSSRFIQVANVSSGSKMPRADWDYVSNFPFPLPPLKEQKSITDLLRLVDTTINKNNLLILQKELYKKGLKQGLLTGKKRLKGLENEKWKEYELNELYKHSKGQLLSKDKIGNSGKYKCVLYGELFTTYDEVIYEVKSKTDFNEGTLSKYGDILMPGSTTTTGIDLTVTSAILEGDVLLGGDIIIFRMKNDLTNPIFMSYFLTNTQKRKILPMTQGVTIIHVYGGDLMGIKFSIPSKETQTEIAKVIQAADKEIKLLKTKTEKLREQKKGLMQQLLTGKKRILKLNDN